MKIALGADHRGYAYKEFIKTHITQYDGRIIQWVDVGAFDAVRSDYPVFAQLVARQVACKEVERGILLCGSGIGMAVAANRYAQVYAGVVWNEVIARMAYEHDKINVLVIPADFVTAPMAQSMVMQWLGAIFLGGRHLERITMIDAIK